MCLAIGHQAEAIAQPATVEPSHHLSSRSQKLEATETNNIEVNLLSKPVTVALSSNRPSRHLSEETIYEEGARGNIEDEATEPDSVDSDAEDDFDDETDDAAPKKQEIGEDVYLPSRDQVNPPAIVEIARTDAYFVPEEPEVEEEVRDPSDFLEEEDKKVPEELNDIPTNGRCILNELIDEFDQLIGAAERQGKYFIRLNSHSYENAMFFANDLLNILDSMDEFQEGVADYYDVDHSTDDTRGINQDIHDPEDVYFEDDYCSEDSPSYDFHSIKRAPCKADKASSILDQDVDLNANFQEAPIASSTLEDPNECADGHCGQDSSVPEAEDGMIVDESRLRRRAVRRGLTFGAKNSKTNPYTSIRIAPMRRLYRRMKAPRYSAHFIPRHIQNLHKTEVVRMHHILI